jgi:hypothetical protein
MSSITGHDSRGKSVFIVTTTTFVLASIFVAARLVSRFGIVKNRTADDWCMILAWVSDDIPVKRDERWKGIGLMVT